MPWAFPSPGPCLAQIVPERTKTPVALSLAIRAVSPSAERATAAPKSRPAVAPVPESLACRGELHGRNEEPARTDEAGTRSDGRLNVDHSCPRAWGLGSEDHLQWDLKPYQAPSQQSHGTHQRSPFRRASGPRCIRSALVPERPPRVLGAWPGPLPQCCSWHRPGRRPRRGLPLPSSPVPGARQRTSRDWCDWRSRSRPAARHLALMRR